MTLRTKLILLYSALVAVVILTFGLGVFWVIRSSWIETVDNALNETVQQVIKNSRSWLVAEFGAPSYIAVQLPELDTFRASGVMVQAWSKMPEQTDYKLDAKSDNLRNYTNPLDPSGLSTSEPVYHNVRVNGLELRVLTYPYRDLPNERILGKIQVAASLQTINQATNRLALLMLGGGALAILASFGLGTWLSSQTMKPIHALMQAADGISTAKDLKTRLRWDGPMDELGRMTCVFNHMMDRIEHLFGAQQRLVADVSHELRTPLTAIRGNLEMAQRYGMDQESMEAIHSEAERMSRLVDDLLMLARADAGHVMIEMAEVDLDTVMNDVLRQARTLAKDRDLTIKLTQMEPLRVRGNGDRLKQLMLNLVSNAIKFTPDGGHIEMALRRDGEHALMQVADDGVGIRAEDMAHIFNRFYQADASRARSQQSGGTGLGLAIAKWITEAHGGSIQVESEPGVRTVFRVALPLPEQPAAEPAGMNGALGRLGFNRRKVNTPEV